MEDIALLPLGAVLFPGGLLPLRIFEPRYVDMVRTCLRAQSPFGVVLILEGAETGSTVSVADVGTSSRIVDFQTQPDGLLGLLCRGEQRFRVLERRQQADGLNRAAVEWLPPAARIALDAKYQPLVTVLRQAIERLANLGQFIEPAYDDAVWVSNRLAEFLPLESASQQRLLEIEDANERLEILAPLIETGL
ncbi:MAG TPA: LON peptidase substrate-binding domain-containing protein [Steroidobacteraceae bacterium]|jgi:hypothetical protein